MLIALALDQAGSHPAAAAEPEAPGEQVLHARFWIDHVVAAERAGFELVTIEDSHRPATGEGDGVPDPGRLDAVMIACRVAPAARHIGMLPAVATTLTEPFLVSSQIATLDLISRGRGGWLAQVVTDVDAGGYVGPREVPRGAERFEEAAEHIEAVRRLWDSWDDDAEIRDAAAQRFIDRERIHHVGFAGRYFNIRGPSITPRPPQGQPVIAMVVDREDSARLAGAGADVALVVASGEAAVARAAETVRSAAIAAGRDASQLRVLADVDVVLDVRDCAAAERRERLDGRSAPAGDRLRFIGTPSGLAEQLTAWSRAGLDGFRLRPAVLADDLPLLAATIDVMDATRHRARPAPATLREQLGLRRPANPHATA